MGWPVTERLSVVVLVTLGATAAYAKPAQPTAVRPKVAVIGLGVAGMTAAAELRAQLGNGVEIVGYEREGIVGGRAASEQKLIPQLSRTHTYTVQHGAQMASPKFANVRWAADQAGLRHEEVESGRYSAFVHEGTVKRFDRTDPAGLLTAGLMTRKDYFQALETYNTLYPTIRSLSLSDRRDWSTQVFDRHPDTWLGSLLGPTGLELASAWQEALYFKPIGAGNAATLWANMAGFQFSETNPISYRNGFGAILNGLRGKLDAVHTNTAVDKIERVPGGVLLHSQRGVEKFDRVILATTASVAERLYPKGSTAEDSKLHEEATAFFSRFRYAPTYNLVVATDRRFVDGVYGLVNPDAERKKIDAQRPLAGGRHIAAISFESGRLGGSSATPNVPEGTELMHLMLNSDGAEQLRRRHPPGDPSSERLIREHILTEADEVLPGIRKSVVWSQLYHHPEAVPVMQVGESARIAAYDDKKDRATLIIDEAGDYKELPMTEGAAQSGRAAGRRIARSLRAR